MIVRFVSIFRKKWFFFFLKNWDRSISIRCRNHNKSPKMANRQRLCHFILDFAMETYKKWNRIMYTDYQQESQISGKSTLQLWSYFVCYCGRNCVILEFNLPQNITMVFGGQFKPSKSHSVTFFVMYCALVCDLRGQNGDQIWGQLGILHKRE